MKHCRLCLIYYNSRPLGFFSLSSLAPVYNLFFKLFHEVKSSEFLHGDFKCYLFTFDVCKRENLHVSFHVLCVSR